MISNVTVLGKIVSPVVLEETSRDRIPILNLRVEAYQIGNNEPQWVDCTIWKGLAKMMAETLSENDVCWIEGSFKIIESTDEIGRRQNLRIKVNRIYKVRG